LAFPSSQIIGYDFAEAAIEAAKFLYPNVDFISVLNKDNKYDVIFCSNVLEHFRDPFKQIVLRLAMINKYYIALVPYKDNLKCPEHFYSFDENSFPNKINDFTKVQSTIITDIKRSFWDGYQLLVVYKKDHKD